MFRKENFLDLKQGAEEFMRYNGDFTWKGDLLVPKMDVEHVPHKIYGIFGSKEAIADGTQELG